MEPNAKIEITEDGFLVIIEHGFSEIYIDRHPTNGYLMDGQSKEFMVPYGEHECGVYSQGRFVAQAKHVFGKAKAAPAEEPEAAPEEAAAAPVEITLDRDLVRAMVRNLEALAAAMKSWLEE